MNNEHIDTWTDPVTVLIHRGGRGQSFVYELLYDGQGDSGDKFLLGLIDAGTLRNDANRGGENTDRGISGAGQGHPKGGPGAVAENSTPPNTDGHETQPTPETDENARSRDISKNRNRIGKPNVEDEGLAAAVGA